MVDLSQPNNGSIIIHPLQLLTTIQFHSINHNLYYNNNNNKLIIPSVSYGVCDTIDPTTFF